MLFCGLLALRFLANEEQCGTSTFTVAHTSYTNCDFEGGSGVSFKKGTVVITHCVFMNFVGGTSRGAICRCSESAKLKVEDTNVTKCQAKDGTSCFEVVTSAEFTGCRFTENLQSSKKWELESDRYPSPSFCLWGYGYGCILVGDGNSIPLRGKATITDCVFKDNANGAVSQWGDARVTLDSCEFENNWAADIAGEPQPYAGDIVADGKELTVLNCSFVNERASTGRSVYVNVTNPKHALKASFRDCTFRTGQQSEGSTMYVGSGGSPEELLLDNCSFFGPGVHLEAAEPITIAVYQCVTFENTEDKATSGSIDFNGSCVVYGSEVGPVTDSWSTNTGGGEIDESSTDEGGNSDSDGNKLSGGEIAAIVVVLLIVIIVVVLLLFFLVFRRRYGRGSDSHSGEATSEVTGTESTATGAETTGTMGVEFGIWNSEAPSSDGKDDSD